MIGPGTGRSDGIKLKYKKSQEKTYGGLIGLVVVVVIIIILCGDHDNLRKRIYQAVHIPILARISLRYYCHFREGLHLLPDGVVDLQID